MKILGKAKEKVRIGYTTHNGCDKNIAFCANRKQAAYICSLANKQGKTNEQKAAVAILELREFLVEKGV